MKALEEMQARVAELEGALQDALVKLKTPDMGGLYLGKARDILEAGLRAAAQPGQAPARCWHECAHDILHRDCKACSPCPCTVGKAPAPRAVAPDPRDERIHELEGQIAPARLLLWGMVSDLRQMTHATPGGHETPLPPWTADLLRRSEAVLEKMKGSQAALPQGSTKPDGGGK